MSFIGEEYTLFFKYPHKKCPRDLKQEIERAMQHTTSNPLLTEQWLMSNRCDHSIFCLME